MKITKTINTATVTAATINPKAVVISVDQHSNKYSIDINDFVKLAHVEQ